MAISEELNHALRAQERLTEQFKNQPNILKLINVFTDQIQELEAAIFDVIEITDLDQAEGVQLDTIGKLINLPRAGRTDVEYREALIAQIFVNRSDGSDTYVTSAFELFTGAVVFVIDEPEPATVRYQVDNNLNPDVDWDHIGSVATAVSAGVRLWVLTYNQASTVFTLDTGLGLSDTNVINSIAPRLAELIEI